MKNSKINILTYRWHASHQYELWKLDCKVTMVRGAGTSLCETWDYTQRPLPSNANFKDAKLIKPEEYDLAILHFDENVLHPELCNGKETADWGNTFKYILSLTSNIPRVAICHGTPQFVGQYDLDFKGPEPVQIYEESRKELVELLKETLVVCNSYQSEKEWGFKKSTTIWHGFSPEEYLYGTHKRDCLVPLKSSVIKRAYCMGYHEIQKLKELLAGSLRIEHTLPPDPKGDFADNQAWAVAKYDNYRREIGHYSFYLNTTLRSCMPRSRGEAMMAGVIPLSLNNHDVDLFIKNGINGYYADTVEELADFAMFLKKNPMARKKASVAARETAIDVFNSERYLSEWSKLITHLTS